MVRICILFLHKICYYYHCISLNSNSIFNYLILKPVIPNLGSDVVLMFYFMSSSWNVKPMFPKNLCFRMDIESLVIKTFGHVCEGT